jgi:hypothetical protein
MATEELLNFKLSDFSEKGLHLIFQDSNRLVLSEEKIKQFALKFLEDPAKVPPHIKKAVDFQACPICPKRHTGEFCHALCPCLPFLEIIDKYISLTKVTAVYKEREQGLLYVSNTDMQKALQFTSILSLMHYCEIGKQYRKYFFGVIPLMEIDDIVRRIYLNIYMSCYGDKKSIDAIIRKFQEEIFVTTSCQVKRLNLICKNDALVNALVLTQTAVDLLSLDINDAFKQLFDDE